jgi:molecular chaperone DnaK
VDGGSRRLAVLERARPGTRLHGARVAGVEPDGSLTCSRPNSNVDVEETTVAKVVGIDLGTTNSVIATVEGGHPTVIPNAEGSRTTPSVVAFTDQGERLVGQLARRQAILNPKGTIYSAKRFIGRRYDEVTSEMKAVSFDVVSGPDGAVRFDIRGKLYAPEEISALVLRKLVEDASKFLGEKIT